MKKQHRIIQREHRQRELQERLEAEGKEKSDGGQSQQPRLYELRDGAEYKGINSFKKRINK